MANKSEKKSINSYKYRTVVFRSNTEIYAQVVNDKGDVIAAASSKEVSEKVSPKEKAFMVGEKLAEKAKAKNINNIYFDRNGYQYHGRVESLSEGMRKGGLKF